MDASSSSGAAGARAASQQGEIALASGPLPLAPPSRSPSKRASADAAATPQPADGSFREADEVRNRRDRYNSDREPAHSARAGGRVTAGCQKCPALRKERRVMGRRGRAADDSPQTVKN